MARLKHYLIAILFLIFSSYTSADCERYVGNQSDMSGGFLNLTKNDKICIEKENLVFILNEDLIFHGIYYFKNNSKDRQQVTMAFPQATLWNVKYDIEKKNYISNKYIPLEMSLTINDRKSYFDIEKASIRKTEIEATKIGVSGSKQNLLLRNKDFSEIFIKDLNEVEKDAIENARINCRYTKNEYNFPIILWYTIKIDFAPGEIKKIDIRFQRPCFYQDADLEEFSESDGKRYYGYITETINSWHGSKIKEFTAEFIFPKDAIKQIDIKPNGWYKTGEDKFVFKRKDWSPGRDDQIKFTWLSKYEMMSINGNRPEYYSCNNKNWRYLFDGSKKTAWCIDKKLIEGQWIKIRTFQNETKYIKKLKIINGISQEADNYRLYSRPKKILIYFCDIDPLKESEPIGCPTWQKIIELKDTWKEQIIELNEVLNLGYMINLNITEIYEGEKYKDKIYISEIEFE